jgi:alpha-beta hydrolase superfamily lysophospholipase
MMHTILEPIGMMTGAPWRGVAVVVHGLNLKPERLRPLVDEVRQWGIGAVFCSLQGHGENYQPLAGQPEVAARLAAFRQVSYAGWRREILAAYETAATLATDHGAPVFLLAFSLGALLGCELQVTEPTVRFDRMALLAPALALRPVSHLPSLLGRWPQIAIRSLSPRAYRANPATPVAAYLSLRKALSNVQRHPTPVLDVPTLVLMDQHDELVSMRGIQRLIRRHHLTQWRLHPIHKKPTRPDAKFHHLIIDAECVGPVAWQTMLTQIQGHLLDG